MITIETILTLITAVVSYIFGELSKKFHWVENKYLPLQNLAIGLLSAVVYYLVVDDSDIGTAIIMAFSGLMAGGAYDLLQTKKEE